MDSLIGLMVGYNCPICLGVSSLDRRAVEKDCWMGSLVVDLGSWAEKRSTREYGLEPIEVDGIIWTRDGLAGILAS